MIVFPRAVEAVVAAGPPRPRAFQVLQHVEREGAVEPFAGQGVRVRHLRRHVDEIALAPLERTLAHGAAGARRLGTARGFGGRIGRVDRWDVDAGQRRQQRPEKERRPKALSRRVHAVTSQARDTGKG
jgi:hypothetical protein